jgi:hypothetical protein
VSYDDWKLATPPEYEQPAPRSEDLGDETEICGCEEAVALRAELERARAEGKNADGKYRQVVEINNANQRSYWAETDALSLKLAEAIALLKSVRILVSKAPVPDPDGEGPTLGECDTAFAVLAELRDRLACAPAQPAACFACGHPESRHCGADDCPQPMGREPAAPEPSADLDELRSKLEDAERGERDAVAALDANWVMHQRVVAAEAQLAAANRRIDAYERAASDDELRCEIQTLTGEKEAAESQLAAAKLLLWTVRTRLVHSHPESASDIDAFLTPAPSPGAGECRYTGSFCGDTGCPTHGPGAGEST